MGWPQVSVDKVSAEHSCAQPLLHVETSHDAAAKPSRGQADRVARRPKQFAICLLRKKFADSCSFLLLRFTIF